MRNEDQFDQYSQRLTLDQSAALANARYEMSEYGVLSLDVQLMLTTVGIDADSDPFAPTFLNGDN